METKIYNQPKCWFHETNNSAYNVIIQPHQAISIFNAPNAPVSEYDNWINWNMQLDFLVDPASISTSIWRWQTHLMKISSILWDINPISRVIFMSWDIAWSWVVACISFRDLCKLFDKINEFHSFWNGTFYTDSFI